MFSTIFNFWFYFFNFLSCVFKIFIIVIIAAVNNKNKRIIVRIKKLMVFSIGGHFLYVRGYIIDYTQNIKHSQEFEYDKIFSVRINDKLQAVLWNFVQKGNNRISFNIQARVFGKHASQNKKRWSNQHENSRCVMLCIRMWSEWYNKIWNRIKIKKLQKFSEKR